MTNAITGRKVDWEFHIQFCRRRPGGRSSSSLVLVTSRGGGNPLPALQIPFRRGICSGGSGEEAAAPMTGMFVQYLAFIGDLMLGVAIWIAPGALGIFAYRLWRKLR